MCGFQVIDPTLAWALLPRVTIGPAIRWRHTFVLRFVLVSYCTSVVVCISRLLPVVVSLNKYAAPPLRPLLYISDE